MALIPIYYFRAIYNSNDYGKFVGSLEQTANKAFTLIRKKNNISINTKINFTMVDTNTLKRYNFIGILKLLDNPYTLTDNNRSVNVIHTNEVYRDLFYDEAVN